MDYELFDIRLTKLEIRILCDRLDGFSEFLLARSIFVESFYDLNEYAQLRLLKAFLALTMLDC